jgi:hypothetical protein
MTAICRERSKSGRVLPVSCRCFGLNIPAPCNCADAFRTFAPPSVSKSRPNQRPRLPSCCRAADGGAPRTVAACRATRSASRGTRCLDANRRILRRCSYRLLLQSGPSIASFCVIRPCSFAAIPPFSMRTLSQCRHDLTQSRPARFPTQVQRHPGDADRAKGVARRRPAGGTGLLARVLAGSKFIPEDTTGRQMRDRRGTGAGLRCDARAVTFVCEILAHLPKRPRTSTLRS